MADLPQRIPFMSFRAVFSLVVGLAFAFVALSYQGGNATDLKPYIRVPSPNPSNLPWPKMPLYRISFVGSIQYLPNGVPYNVIATETTNHQFYHVYAYMPDDHHIYYFYNCDGNLVASTWYAKFTPHHSGNLYITFDKEQGFTNNNCTQAFTRRAVFGPHNPTMLYNTKRAIARLTGRWPDSTDYAAVARKRGGIGVDGNEVCNTVEALSGLAGASLFAMFSIDASAAIGSVVGFELGPVGATAGAVFGVAFAAKWGLTTLASAEGLAVGTFFSTAVCEAFMNETPPTGGTGQAGTGDSLAQPKNDGSYNNDPGRSLGDGYQPTYTVIVTCCRPVPEQP